MAHLDLPDEPELGTRDRHGESLQGSTPREAALSLGVVTYTDRRSPAGSDLTPRVRVEPPDYAVRVTSRRGDGERAR
jgi:hypothetical protein